MTEFVRVVIGGTSKTKFVKRNILSAKGVKNEYLL